MRTPFRRARHHTVVAAYLALFIALGGSAYAVTSITSDDIVDETIQSRDIGTGAVDRDEIREDAVTLHRLRYDSVNSSKVINGSLSGGDIANGGLSGYDLADGSVKAADLGLTTVTAESSAEAVYQKTVTAYCPAGKNALGGGGHIAGSGHSSPRQKSALTKSAPTGGGGGWTVVGETIAFPRIPETTFAYDGDYVTGWDTYVERDHQTYYGPWVLRAWAVCV
jgi:hypothetical protein